MSTPETTPSVGIVVVSHSRALGNAAVELAREVIGDVDVPIAVAAGLDETTLGTDAAAIATAIATSDRGAGVVGVAVESGPYRPVLLCCRKSRF